MYLVLRMSLNIVAVIIIIIIPSASLCPCSVSLVLHEHTAFKLLCTAGLTVSAVVLGGAVREYGMFNLLIPLCNQTKQVLFVCLPYKNS